MHTSNVIDALLLLASSVTLLSKYELLGTASKYTTILKNAASKFIGSINVEIKKRRHCNHTQQSGKIVLCFTILSQYMTQKLQKPCNFNTTPLEWPERESYTVYMRMVGQNLLDNFNAIMWIYRKFRLTWKHITFWGTCHGTGPTSSIHFPWNIPWE